MKLPPAVSRSGLHPSFLYLFVLLLMVGCGKDPEKYLASGRQYLSQGNYPAAVIELKNALQIKPGHAEARYLLGTCELNLYDFAAAENELRRARELGYSADKTVPPLALALLSQGKLNDLISELGATELSDPRAMAELQTRLGDAYADLGKIKQAQEAFGRALDARPGEPRALVGQSKILALKGNLQGALQQLDEVLAKWPQQPEALALKGGLVHAQGKVDEALGYLRQAVQVQPGNVVTQFSLALMLLEKGDLDEASKQIESMKQIAPRNSRTSYLQGVLAYKRGNLVAAQTSALQILKVSPEHLPSLILAGVVSHELGAQQQAQEYLRKALVRAPRARNLRILLIDSYIRSRDVGAASRLLDQALKETPKDAGLLMLAAELAVASGDLEGAAKALQTRSGRCADCYGRHHPTRTTRVLQRQPPAGCQAA